MKNLLLILTLFVGHSFAQEYLISCDEERWKGNSLTNKSDSSETDLSSDGLSFVLPKLKFKFSLPAKFGDVVTISDNGKETNGVITYFYDRTQNKNDESFIIFLAQPYDIQERWVIYLNSGWVHYTFSKYRYGYDLIPNEFSTNTYAKKCNISK